MPFVRRTSRSSSASPGSTAAPTGARSRSSSRRRCSWRRWAAPRPATSRSRGRRQLCGSTNSSSALSTRPKGSAASCSSTPRATRSRRAHTRCRSSSRAATAARSSSTTAAASFGRRESARARPSAALRSVSRPPLDYDFDMQQVLVLNASFEPLNVCTVRRAHARLQGQGRGARGPRPAAAFRLGHVPLAACHQAPERLRSGPAGRQAQDLASSPLRPGRASLRLLRIGGGSRSTTSCRAPAAATRSGRTSSPPAAPCNLRKGNRLPRSSRCACS